MFLIKCYFKCFPVYATTLQLQCSNSLQVLVVYLLLTSQLSENTAEVVKMALPEMDVESRLSPAGLLFSGEAESGGGRIY